jgi:hypothetical protein
VSDAKGYVASVGADAAPTDGQAATSDGVESSDTQTRVYGGTAVVSGETVMRGRRGGKAFREDTRFLRVYVSRDGRWQMVAGQDTSVPADTDG